MNQETMNQETKSTAYPSHTETTTNRSILGLSVWEVIVLGISIFLIAFIALPNYLSALSMRRGQECSRRMMLITDSLQYLANTNGTQPGEMICEALELNQALDLAQGALKIEGNLSYVPSFFRYGTEPDCSDGGNFVVNFYLGEDGKVIPPTCNRLHEIGEVYCIDRGMHVCDIEKIDGILVEELTDTQPEEEITEAEPAENETE